MPRPNNGWSTARSSQDSGRGRAQASGERLKSFGSDAPAPGQREAGDQDGQVDRKNQGATSSTSDVFQKLYKDAVVKNIKMENLRAKMESAERRRASSQGRLS